MVDTNPTILERVQTICNLIFHQSLAVITVFIFWTILQKYTLTLHSDSTFAWHIFLSTLAYVPLMGEAIVLFASDNIWTQKVSRKTKYWLHGVLLFVSAILASIGIGLLVHQKTRDHFKSRHAWTGLVSWVLVLLSQFLGIAAAKPQIFSRVIRPVYIKLLHNLAGVFGYIFGIVSLAYGLNMGSFKRGLSPESIEATFYVLGFVTVWSIVAALKSGRDQIKAIFS